MELLLFAVLLTGTFAAKCGSHAPEHCKQCKIDGGSVCDLCDKDYFNGGTVCLPCELSKCETCNGQSICASCPPGLVEEENGYCNKCPADSVWINKACVDPGTVGCSSGNGSYICECGKNGEFCCNTTLGVRNHERKYCAACDVGCASCSVKECAKCMAGYELVSIDYGGTVKKPCMNANSASYFENTLALFFVLLLLI
eukprot:TRINITY_DN1746_c0_g1_i3.p1 TRINITY_DN1746_c0_g1~~TRINITY_DN1746_c0_g1_i3.p1  ORF type:complete len:199 (+),score=20.00 TRINITY_DN1746_c0_g1_i3:839-1435(+)